MEIIRFEHHIIVEIDAKLEEILSEEELLTEIITAIINELQEIIKKLQAHDEKTLKNLLASGERIERREEGKTDDRDS